MKPWIKVLFVMLLFGIPAFIVGPLIWPPAVAPQSNLLPFFLFLACAESLTFGLGGALWKIDNCFAHPVPATGHDPTQKCT